MTSTRSRIGAAAFGLLAGVVGTLLLRAWQERPYRCPLAPLALGAETLLLPPGARVEHAGPPIGPSASWAPPGAEPTRCGVEARVWLRQPRNALPDGASHCWRHDFFEGGSGEGDCPVTTACIARRGEAELSCRSDDRTCEAVVAAFVAHPAR